jgi:hypothetical protein
MHNDCDKFITTMTLEQLLDQDSDGENTTSKRPKTNPSKRKVSYRITNIKYRYYDDEERLFYTKLTDEEKGEIALLEKDIHNANNESVPLRFKMLMSNIDIKIKAIAIKKLQYLANMNDSSSELSWPCITYIYLAYILYHIYNCIICPCNGNIIGIELPRDNHIMRHTSRPTCYIICNLNVYKTKTIMIFTCEMQYKWIEIRTYNC